MEWTGLNELREKFLAFFESKEHLRLPSFPLIPRDDNSLLLINSGMAPMKKYFTGEVTPPRKRVTTCQKCIRTPDIERVGITARHGTYFEMLGNFSFGDYFKHEATAWAWEFFTEVLKMPKELLYCSIYENDDEAFDIWTKEVGVDPSHIVRLGKEDNFWEHGSGPCGPCSEIYFDRGVEKGCGKPDCKVGCDCDRFVEVWNLVFTQFENDGKGNYTALDHPNIDTGMGLERLACVMQGVDNLFLVDTVQNIMKKVSEISGVKYGENEKNDVSLRVITDHIRSTTFMIGDGVMPSNEGRGYVLRRLLRRAARHGKLLGVNEPFLYKVCETVINENKSAYPELEEKKELITKLIKVEEESFCKTIEQGMHMLSDIMSKGDIKVLSGEDAFKLNDTYGFPIDLTREILAEKDIDVDIEGFNELLAQQKKRARQARKNAGADAWISENIDLSKVPETKFTGYDELITKATVLAIIKDGNLTDSVYEGENALIITDRTSFYAEGGGQIGDSGAISCDSTTASVSTTSKNPSGIFMHSAKIEKGMISVGDAVSCEVNAQRRHDIMRNHTAGHLLQAALRKVLGNHVEQAGQLVDEHRVRFDFTHFSALTQEELEETQRLVNEQIFRAVDVQVKEMPIAEAKKAGAMALFGEKYGDIVRVVTIPEFSTELCGGTHALNTSTLGLFRILSESSVAAGVRRIEAVTGRGVLELCSKQAQTISEASSALKLTSSDGLVRSCHQLTSELKEKTKTIEKLSGELACMRLGSLLKGAKDINGTQLICSRLDDENADTLKTMCSNVLNQNPDCIMVLASVCDGKAVISAACGKDACKKGGNAGKIVKEVAQLAGGNGGGKPDIAMAGAKEIDKLDDALKAVESIVSNMIQ